MITKGWIKKLFGETEQWVNDGLINSDQRQRIILRYSGRIEYSRLINTITTLGSILIGLGILLFVASNWEKLGRPAKISIIFLVITFFNLASFYFRNIKKEYIGLGEGFLLIGAFSFGAGIWLVAQMYQIHYNFSAGIMFWILGVLPVAYLYRSWTALSLSSILSTIWLSSYFSYYFKREAYGFLFLFIAIVALCYKQKQRFPLFVMIVALALWLAHFWNLNYSLFDYFFYRALLMPQLLLVAIYMALGFILYGLGIWHAKTNRFTEFSFLYKLLGVLFIALSSYSLTFAHHYYKDARERYIFGCPQKVTILIGILLFLAAFVFSRLHRSLKEKLDSIEIRAMFYFLILSFSVILVSLNWQHSASLLFNIMLLAQTLGFMYLGFIKHSEGIFRVSIAIFFLNILSRYFDIFWKMMPRSLLFIFGGVLLIAGAVFAERKRREIEEKMRSGRPS